MAAATQTEVKAEVVEPIISAQPISMPKPALPTINACPAAKVGNSCLKTPISATLPSELPKSPALGARLDALKQEDDDIRTPITPPTAYTEFLKALSPALSSSSTTRSPVFDRVFSGKTTPLTQPSSAASCTCYSATAPSHPTDTSSTETGFANPLKSAAVTSAPIMPPSPYMRPPSSVARTPTTLRKLRIPESPVYSPTAPSASCTATATTATATATATIRTPNTASCCCSASATSATNLRSPWSSADFNIEKMKRAYDKSNGNITPMSAGGPNRAIASPPRTNTTSVGTPTTGTKPVSVRQVVTRTVTYTRANPILDPAPKGKKRRVEL